MKKSNVNYNQEFKKSNSINGTDRIRMQLDKKDYTYRMLFENHKSIMLLIDPDSGSIVEANQAAVSYYGYTRDKLLTMKIHDINILTENEIDEELICSEEEERNYFRSVHRLANNEEREVEVQSFSVETLNGKLLLSTIYDVSEKVQQKLMYDKLFFDSPYGVVILDKDQKIVNINKNFTCLFQYSLEDAKGETIDHLVSPIGGSTQIDNNIQLIYQGEIIKQEGKRKRKDGRLIEVEILAYPVINHNSILGAYIIYIDISSKRAYEKQLLLFKKILENNSEGVVITDVNGKIDWVNKAFTQITGYSPKEILGEKMNILKSGFQDSVFYKNMWERLIEKGNWSGEIWNKNKNGDLYSEWLTIASIKDESNSIAYYVGIFRDLSEKKRIDRRMIELQQKDSLTGLYNRNYFLEMVDSYIDNIGEKEGRFSIFFIDVEGFKEINDSLGHALGNKLLTELSNRLLLSLNENYVLARFCGDEFVILCKNVFEESHASGFAGVLLESIEKPYFIENTILHITANIGISKYPEDGDDAETLIRYADIAMSRAKGHADNKVCFYSAEMSREIEDKFMLSNHLVGAIANRELIIYYQPIYDIKNQRNIMGAEALLRWKNPILGMVSPDKFIPLAEKTGQIIAIGEWVLEQVCKQINLWQCSGYNVVPIAVNISVKQLEQIGFAQIVMEILKRNNVESNCIELEITESVSSGDIDTIVKNLKELKRSGLKISMDDFGTGFSSLGQLDIFELDKLKIDKIFIDDLVDVSKRQDLVRSIIVMAKSLDLMVVAEGIETTEQLSYLRKMGCQLGQGYLFSEPLPVKEIEILLNPNSRHI